MKKNFKYAILSAIALVGAVNLTSCSSSDDVADVNPTYDGKTVKAQFALSIPGYGQQTRMTNVNTQNNSNFLGITALRFYPFNTSSTRTGGEFAVANGDSYGGATVITSGNDDFTAYENTNAKDKWYKDVLVPTETNAFLVYGKAIKSGSDFAQGKILASYDKTESASDLVDIGEKPTKITFEQVPIYTGNAAAFSTAGQTITTQLNTIASASGALTDGGDNVTWATVGGYSDAVATENGVKLLKDLYVSFTTASYAGSARSVKAMLEDLKETLSTMSAYNIDGRLVKDIYDKTDAAITAIGSSTFPTDLNLPEGAAKMTYNATDGFAFGTDGNVIGASSTDVNKGINKYVYPSELYYRANTPIRVANKEIETLITSSQNWSDVIGLYQATDKTVTSTTRSIALVDPLQYAVGCLDTWVKLGNASELEENVIVSGTGENAVYKKVDISNGLKLTGVLVGAQDNVNWAFKHTGVNGTNVIYDKDIDVNKNDAPAQNETPAVDYHLTSTEYTHMNYTLVMETTGVDGTISDDNTEAVYVALEFENDFADFCGVEGNLIPQGTKFYLVGKLDLKTTDKSRNNVFEQDYTTKAQFSVTSLKNAYNIVPDLRTPSLELGLSVNLEWTPGLTFTVNL